MAVLVDPVQERSWPQRDNVSAYVAMTSSIQTDAVQIVSLISIVAMVFAQLAVAAYACPMQFQGLDNSVATVTATAAEPDAGDYDTSAPALCKKHCEDGQQNVNDAPQTHAFLSFESALTLTMAIQPATSGDAPVATPSLQNATAPPHSIRNCCFRI